MELMSIGKFAKRVGVSTSTLRKWDRDDVLKPCHVSEGRTRYYSTEQLKTFQKAENDKKLVIGYCRVSTASQKDDLVTQVEYLKLYMLTKGYQFEIIQDIGSGIDYKKKGLQQLIEKVNNREISKIVVLYKDGLVQFGFEMIEYLCEINGVQLEVIDHTQNTKEEELTSDFIQIVTFFANRLYGTHSKKAKRLLDEVKNNVHIDKDQT